MNATTQVHYGPTGCACIHSVADAVGRYGDRPRMLRSLVEKGVAIDLPTQNSKANTAFTLAIGQGCEEMALSLLEMRCDTHYKNALGKSGLDLAQSCGMHALARVLKRAGCKRTKAVRGKKRKRSPFFPSRKRGDIRGEAYISR